MTILMNVTKSESMRNFCKEKNATFACKNKIKLWNLNFNLKVQNKTPSSHNLEDASNKM